MANYKILFQSVYTRCMCVNGYLAHNFFGICIGENEELSLNILLLIIYERTLKKKGVTKGHTDDIDRFASQSIIFERILVIGFEFKFASSNELP